MADCEELELEEEEEGVEEGKVEDDDDDIDYFLGIFHEIFFNSIRKIPRNISQFYCDIY